VTVMNNASHIVSNSKAGERGLMLRRVERDKGTETAMLRESPLLTTVGCVAALQFVVQSCELVTRAQVCHSPSRQKFSL
jgi:hypothetical protein